MAINAINAMEAEELHAKWLRDLRQGVRILASADRAVEAVQLGGAYPYQLSLVADQSGNGDVFLISRPAPRIRRPRPAGLRRMDSTMRYQ